jgi:5-methylcytosine-specific restriction endonuclease McrA
MSPFGRRLRCPASAPADICTQGCVPPPINDAQLGNRIPKLGVAFSWRGAMSRHSLHRVALPRAPRGLCRRRHPSLAIGYRRALKRATLRDCCRRCVYCGSLLALDVATIDHVLPLAKGGAHAPGNLVVACAPCNRLKGDMLPTEFFVRHPAAGLNFLTYARVAHRALKRGARRAVSVACAAAA